MIATVIHESRKWVVATASDRTEITNLLAVKETATRTLTGTDHVTFAGQFEKAVYGPSAVSDTHDLITEWYHS